MKRLGIPAYVYAQTQFPNQAVHKFNGVIALPQALSISESDWADDTRTEAASKRVFQAIKEIDQPWIGLFVGHPTKFRYTDWWDTPYYAGRTPPEPEYGTPVSQETYGRSKVNLGSFLRQLKTQHEIVGVDEALELPWQFSPPSPAELKFYIEHTSANLRGAKNWPIHCAGLDPELIVQKTLALNDTLKVGSVD